MHLSARTNRINGPAYVLEASAGEGEPQLRLFQRDFQFEWLGRFNPDRSLYVFPGGSGPPGSGGDGSVRLRTVQTGETRTLIESDQSNQYTLPRFYGDQIIYVRGRQLWSVDVNGSNTFKLFELPPGADNDTE
jgi:hypothetical protein